MGPIIPYVPKRLVTLPRLAPPPTANPDAYMAWRGLDQILVDIMERFDVGQNKALEVGVEFGYSATALACLFKRVYGIDTFLGDKHSGIQQDHYLSTKERLKSWANLTLFQSDYQSWISKDDDDQYDLIHVDIVHTYEDTFACGLWAVQHAPVVLFHDTTSFLGVRSAVRDIAEKANLVFHNFEPCNGLGILVKTT